MSAVKKRAAQVEAPEKPVKEARRSKAQKEAVAEEKPFPPPEVTSNPAYGVVEPLAVFVRWCRMRFYEKVAERSNLKLDKSAINILGSLKVRGPMRTSDLAEILGLDRSTVSRQVSAVVEQGLVAREDHAQDARAAILSLTNEGRVKQQKLAHAWHGIAMELVADWDYADQMEIARLLTKLAQEIEKDYRT